MPFRACSSCSRPWCAPACRIDRMQESLTSRGLGVPCFCDKRGSHILVRRGSDASPRRRAKSCPAALRLGSGELSRFPRLGSPPAARPRRRPAGRSAWAPTMYSLYRHARSGSRRCPATARPRAGGEAVADVGVLGLPCRGARLALVVEIEAGPELLEHLPVVQPARDHRCERVCRGIPGRSYLSAETWPDTRAAPVGDGRRSELALRTTCSIGPSWSQVRSRA